MRQISTFLCLLSLLAISFGCDQATNKPSDSTTTESTPNAGGKTVTRGTIALSVLTLTNPFFKTIGDSVTEAAKAKGYNTIVVSGDEDVNKQSAQVDDFIVKNVAAMIIVPCDRNAIGAAIKKANDAGIPVFTIDAGYDGDEAKVVSHIATDNLQGGKLAGEAMVKLIGETGGKVAILHYPQARSCQLRVKGFKEIVEAHNASGKGGKIEVVSELDGGAARDKGYTVTKDIIQANGDLAAVFAINDPSALGAYKALEEAGKADQVKIIGFDGQKIGKQAILEGKIVCDPIQFPDRMGQMTVDVIINHLSGEEVKPEYLIPAELYYKEDAEKDPALKS